MIKALQFALLPFIRSNVHLMKYCNQLLLLAILHDDISHQFLFLFKWSLNLVIISCEILI